MLRWFRQLFKPPCRPETRDRTDAQQQALIADLIDYISDGQRAASVLEQAAHFQALSPSEQRSALPAVYLRLEQYLTEVAPYKPVSKEHLRRLVPSRYGALLALPGFALIFQPIPRQEVLLCTTFLQLILQRSITVLGSAGNNRFILAREWLTQVPESAALPIPFQDAAMLPQHDADWLLLLEQMARELYLVLENALGAAATSRFFEHSYETMAESYVVLETFPVVISLIPDHLLDDYKISLLSQRQVQRVLAEKIAHLQTVNAELLQKNEELARTYSALATARESERESATQLSAVLDTVGEGILTIDATGRIVLVNQEVQHIWGFGSQQLLGEPLHRLISTLPWTPEALDEPAQLEASLLPFIGHRMELQGYRQDGSSFPLEIRMTETQVGPRLFYTAAVRDITERKRMDTLKQEKDAAQAANQAKSEFLANMSHELRTPLHGILSFADLGLDQLSTAPPEKLTHYFQRIRQSGQTLLTLLNDLLDLAKLEAGKMAFSFESADLSWLLRQVLDEFYPLAVDRQLNLQTDLPDGPVDVVLDPEKIKQVMRNLLSNAIKFSPVQSTLSCCLSQQPETVTLTVRDEGIGIPEDELDSIFDKFVQSSKTRTGAGGTGLGLSICWEIVTAHGGRIWAENGLEGGAIFYVEFPCLRSLPRLNPAGHENDMTSHAQ